MRQLREAVLSLSLFLSASIAVAQGVSNPIKLVVPTSPGSAADLGARSIADQLQTMAQQSVIVENRVGAGGSVAARAVAAAPADGATIGIVGSTYLLYPIEFPGIAFDPKKDILPFAMIGRVSNVLIVSPNSPYSSLKGLIADAQARPGKLTYASAGHGSSTYWSAERMRSAAKVDAVHVPFKGSPEVVNEILAGRVDFGYVPVSVAAPFVTSGKVKALAISAGRRSTTLPDVPTSDEAGISDSVYESWLIATLPGGAPRELQERLNRQFNTILGVPEIVERLKVQGVDPEPMSLEAVRTFVDKQYDIANAMAAAAKATEKK